MDQLDISIIQALQEDARKSYTDIAKLLNVAEGTVRNRVSRLLADDTLRLRATFDYLKVGFDASAVMTISVQPGMLDKVAKALQVINEVSYLMAITGDADLLVELTCRDNKHLLDVISNKIGKIPGITDTSTNMVLQVYKELLPSLSSLQAN